MTKVKISFIFLLFFLLITPLRVISLECEEINDKEQKISCLDKKVKDLGQTANSLRSQIQYMDTQIYLTELKIIETENKIISTQKEIELITTKIEGLDISLNYLSKLLIKKIVAGYKQKSISVFNIILDSNNANDFISKIKYLKSAQDNNQRLLIQVQEIKMNFEEQKILREEKKVELNDLEKSLITQKSDLAYQKSQKEALLRDTQNDDVRYRQLLQQAMAEYNAVQKALAVGTKIGAVKKGDPIAMVGNSGYPNCSTGPHLHFEVRTNNTWVNAENYLSSKTIEDRQSNSNQTIGNGSWDWPIQDPIVVEQRYGTTPWSWRYKYSGGTHTGIDMWSRNGDIIRAPADGTLYTSAEDCSGSVINIKYIDHTNGIISFYLHVQ